MAAIVAASPALVSSAPHITIYRDRGCGCCEGWTAAVRAAGYQVDLLDLDHVERVRRFGISEAVASCHTALISGYLLEGHVPLNAVSKLLREFPKTRGIALPGMPSGVPGMPGPKTSVRVVFIDDPNRVYYTE